jgi:hypothetical protein
MLEDLTATMAALLQSAEYVRRQSERVADLLQGIVEKGALPADSEFMNAPKVLADWVEAAENYDALMQDLWLGSKKPSTPPFWTPAQVEAQAQRFREER